jgi:mitotic spindle assembly checkpoint protein MAD2B
MAVETQLLKCTVAAVSVVILSVHTNRPLERYTFDMSQMPHIPASDIHTPFERSAPNKPSADDSKNTNTNNNPASVDLEAQFRAVLARLASACARLTPLPAEEEYLPTLHIVLRPDADAPAGVTKDEQLWIAADPEHLENDDESLRGFSDSEFGDSRSQRDAGDGQGPEGQNKRSRARAKTVPVRTVDAGEVKLEVWVEEAKGKFEELDRIHSENSPC